MDRLFKKFSPATNEHQAILMGCENAWIISLDNLNRSKKLSLSQLKEYIQKNHKNFYWILINDGYQILPQKYRLGSTLDISDDSLQKISSLSPDASFRKNIFAVEQLLNLRNNTLIKLTTTLTRHITVNRFKSITKSHTALDSLTHLTTQKTHQKELSLEKTISLLEEKISKQKHKLFTIGRWRQSVQQLLTLEVIILAILLFTMPVSFFTRHNSIESSKPIFIPQTPNKPTKVKTAPKWTSNRLDMHLKALSNSLDSIKNIIIQDILFTPPTITISGYWKQKKSTLALQQEWEEMLDILHRNPIIQDLKTQQNPLQGNLAKQRKFTIKLQINP
jgi:hypothetical protein